MRLVELLPEHFSNHPQGGLCVDGITADHRQLRPGFLFIALTGKQFDGRAFIESAFKAGAVAVVCERPIDQVMAGGNYSVPVFHVPDIRARQSELAALFYPAPDVALVGVTGTNGKTSTTHYLAQVSDAMAMPTALLGTNGNGFRAALSESSHTTPDLLSVSRLLVEFAHAGAKQVAMEVSSHALDQGRVKGLPFSEAIFTNLTRDHLDYHGSMANYGAAKAKLFNEYPIERAIINLDDPFAEELLASLPPNVHALGYGFTARPEMDCLEVRNFVPSAAGFHAEVQFLGECALLESSLLGRFNLSNLLAVGGLLLGRGVSLQKVSRLLAKVVAVTGRMQAFRAVNAPLMVVDYAHTPDALEKALLALREHTKARLHVVFGCGGDRDRGKRPQMARIAQQLADCVIVTSDNPRTEPPAQIIDEIVVGFDRPEGVLVDSDRAAAIAMAHKGAAPEDVVLIAGKGHESYQEIMGVRHPFSDIEQVKLLMGAAV